MAHCSRHGPGDGRAGARQVLRHPPLVQLQHGTVEMHPAGGTGGDIQSAHVLAVITSLTSSSPAAAWLLMQLPIRSGLLACRQLVLLQLQAQVSVTTQAQVSYTTQAQARCRSYGSAPHLRACCSPTTKAALLPLRACCSPTVHTAASPARVLQPHRAHRGLIKHVHCHALSTAHAAMDVDAPGGRGRLGRRPQLRSYALLARRCRSPGELRGAGLRLRRAAAARPGKAAEPAAQDAGAIRLAVAAAVASGVRTRPRPRLRCRPVRRLKLCQARLAPLLQHGTSQPRPWFFRPGREAARGVRRHDSLRTRHCSSGCCCLLPCVQCSSSLSQSAVPWGEIDWCRGAESQLAVDSASHAPA